MIVEIFKFFFLMISVWLQMKREKITRNNDQTAAEKNFQSLLEMTLKERRQQAMTELEKLKQLEDEANRQIEEIQASNNSKGKGN